MSKQDDQIEETEPARQRRFPTAFTVLAIVLLSVWVLSFVIPSGRYEIDPETGGPMPGTYTEVPACEGEKSPDCVDKSLPEQLRSCGSRRPTASTGSRTRGATSAPSTPASSTARQ